jgi:ABC-type sugar transport system ATPase subunit
MQIAHGGEGAKSMNTALLEALDLSKKYAGVLALAGVSFRLMPGTVHALCGENGAGKSTLVKILMGIIQRDGGEVIVKGCKVRFFNPRQALGEGISIIEQELSPVPDMTIAENIFLGREGSGLNPFINYRALNRRAEKILATLSLDLDPRTKMKRLKVAQIQLVEIAKALSYDSDIIIMDEPTSAIGEREVEKLFAVLRTLKARGKGIIYITHRMNEIFDIADEITVLRDGRLVDSGPAGDFDREKLIGCMIGRKIDAEYVKENVPGEEVLLEVKDFSRKGEFSGIDLTLRRSEILGVFGLLGSGRTEFLNALYGVTKAESGSVLLDGKEIRISSPRKALKRRIGYVTEDRKETGLVLDSSVGDNISVAALRSMSYLGFVRRSTELSKIREAISLFGIKTPSIAQLVRRLSGGNQQKVVLGRWILIEPRVLLLDEPTRGIDVGAKREIYKFISDFASRGNAVLMVSSELPEIIGMSDRIAVFKEGRLAGIMDRAEAKQESLMDLAM